MDQPARVFFDMDTGDSGGDFGAFGLERQRPCRQSGKSYWEI